MPDIVTWLFMGISICGVIWFIVWLGGDDQEEASEEKQDEVML